MDSLITAAARALAAGDPLGALNLVALRRDPPALALRGIAMAQLGDLQRARDLVRRAARAFGPREPVARARCVVAAAEIAIAARDLGWPAAPLELARTTLEAHGDRINAAWARHLEVRRLLMVGRLGEAERALAALDTTPFAPAARAAHELVVAGLSIRRLRTRPARAALERAVRASREARIPALQAEVERLASVLSAPAASRVVDGEVRLLRLEEVEALRASGALLIDACRSGVGDGRGSVSLASRPVLFGLARALGEAWPGDAPRAALLARAFGARFVDESHRARLRVEIGRLRSALRELATVTATPRGFALAPRRAREVVVISPPVEDEHAALLALLADGEPWSSSALALSLGTSQRNVQRALGSLAAAGKAQGWGRGRALRWTIPPMPGLTTTLLLPVSFPGE